MKIIVETKDQKHEFEGDHLWWGIDGEVLDIHERVDEKVVGRASFRGWVLVRMEEE